MGATVLKAVAVWSALAVLAIINGTVRETFVIPTYALGLHISGVVLALVIFVVTWFAISWFRTLPRVRYWSI